MLGGGVCTVVSFFILVFQMKSIGYNATDGSLYLETDTVRPKLKDGDVMIKVTAQINRTCISSRLKLCCLFRCTMQVEAAGVNRLDLIQAVGKYPPPPGESNILGVEGIGLHV